ncbi:KxYKxGKxW signal peptide domain-containing protein, partial [Lactiplantibacillus pentosus]|uniref:KxYKxGKxW signal peptide domain-containing protein n=1 Tax=Lactiplantibacillus pentosus TaxID=1589 RepID=UPI0021A41FEC
MQKRRLQRARLTEKRTYKMYKKGRFWLVAGLGYTPTKVDKQIIKACLPRKEYFFMGRKGTRYS